MRTSEGLSDSFDQLLLVTSDLKQSLFTQIHQCHCFRGTNWSTGNDLLRHRRQLTRHTPVTPDHDLWPHSKEEQNEPALSHTLTQSVQCVQRQPLWSSQSQHRRRMMMMKIRWSGIRRVSSSCRWDTRRGRSAPDQPEPLQRWWEWACSPDPHDTPPLRAHTHTHTQFYSDVTLTLIQLHLLQCFMGAGGAYRDGSTLAHSQYHKLLILVLNVDTFLPKRIPSLQKVFVNALESYGLL